MARSQNKQLTREVVGPARKSDLIVSLVGMVVVFFAVNWALGVYLQEHPLNRGYWLIQEHWSKLLSDDFEADWLVVGDSSGSVGVDMRVFNKATDTDAWNLCTYGNMLVVEGAWMVQEHIQRHGPPAGVVMVHVYDVWMRSPSQVLQASVAKLPLPWGAWARYEPPLELSAGEQVQMLLGRHFPLYAESVSVGRLLQLIEPIKDMVGMGLPPKPFKLGYAGYMGVEDEAIPHSVRSDAQEHTVYIKQRLADGRVFEPSEANRRALQRIIDLGEQHGFDVYLANSPLYDELYRNPDFQRFYRGMVDYFAQIDDQHDNFHYILRQPVLFPAEMMTNADHVTTEAAKTFARKLAEAVNDARAR